MKRLFIYVGPILLCFIVGWISMLFQSDSLVEWYPLLNKPSVTPPNFVFPIAWSILYIYVWVCRSADSLIVVSGGL